MKSGYWGGKNMVGWFHLWYGCFVKTNLRVSISLKFLRVLNPLFSFKNPLKIIKTRLKKLPPAGGKMVGWYDRCMKIQKLGAPRSYS